MARRSCEVTLRLSNGRSYTAVMDAESTYGAALAFQRHCENSPPDLQRPRVDYNAVVDVKPIYKGSVRKAMIRAVEKEARAGRNKPQR